MEVDCSAIYISARKAEKSESLKHFSLSSLTSILGLNSEQCVNKTENAQKGGKKQNNNSLVLLLIEISSGCTIPTVKFPEHWPAA